MITIDLVDSINEKINLFNDTYGTDIVAVFPEREEVYVRDMCQFLKAYFADYDDEAFVDADHNLRTVENSVLTQDKRYQVFLQDDYTGYTVIGEYETESAAKEAIEACIERQYTVTVSVSFEVSLTVTASNSSEAEDAAYQYCADSMDLESRYSSNEDIDDWDVTDSNIEVTDVELA